MKNFTSFGVVEQDGILKKGKSVWLISLANQRGQGAKTKGISKRA
jgi:hypothetical protein